MPQQLLYTSAPRGIVAGRSGHCTVARSAAMRDALVLQLEKLSYYQHLSLSGGQERPIYTARILDIRGARFHVLSRIQDAGLDFTGRTNFIAHHLVFMPEEVRRFPAPPVILRDWPGWAKCWTREPELLENENWDDLTALAGKTHVPALTWQQVTGDGANGYGLLEVRAGASFRVDDQADETVLTLFAESLALLEVRDPRRDFRAAAWNYTFTTSMQEQDNPADFRWRCLHSDNPAASCLATPDCRALSAVRAAKYTAEEGALARTGRQAPRFLDEPRDVSIREGESARLVARAEGVPNPGCQWFSVDRSNQRQPLPGGTKPDLVLPNLPRGISRFVVCMSNNAGTLDSRVAAVSVEPKKESLAIRREVAASSAPAKAHVDQPKAASDSPDGAQMTAPDPGRYISGWWLLVFLLAMLAIGGTVWIIKRAHAPIATPTNPIAGSTNSGSGIAKAAPLSAGPANPPAAAGSSQGGLIFTDAKPLPERTMNPPPTEFDLPPGWNEVSIGKVLNPHAEYIPGGQTLARFELSGIAGGFATNHDDVLFVYQTNWGMDFTTELLQIDSDSPLRRSGIMVRDSTQPDSRFLFLGTSRGNVMICGRDEKVGFSENGDIIANNQAVSLRFARQQNTMMPFYSIDHETWRTFQGYSFRPSKPPLVGFAICSGNSSNRVKVRFLDLSTRTTR